MTVINEEIYLRLRALDKIYLEQWMKLAMRYTQIEDCRQQAPVYYPKRTTGIESAVILISKRYHHNIILIPLQEQTGSQKEWSIVNEL